MTFPLFNRLIRWTPLTLQTMAELQRYDLRRQTMLDLANLLTSFRRLKRLLTDQPRFTSGVEADYEMDAVRFIDNALLPLSEAREALESLDTV